MAWSLILALARFASDSFDMAVLQAPSAEHLHATVRELTRAWTRIRTGE